ncbi:MAG: hypothetical protein ACRDQB_17085, partial [Thermocrispum sp.]
TVVEQRAAATADQASRLRDEALQEAERLIGRAREDADQIVAAAHRQAAQVESHSRDEAQRTLETARDEAAAFHSRRDDIVDQLSGLRDLISSLGSEVSRRQEASPPAKDEDTASPRMAEVDEERDAPPPQRGGSQPVPAGAGGGAAAVATRRLGNISASPAARHAG